MWNVWRIYVSIYPLLGSTSSAVPPRAPCTTVVTARACWATCGPGSFRRISMPTGRVVIKFNRRINSERGRASTTRACRAHQPKTSGPHRLPRPSGAVRGGQRPTLRPSWCEPSDSWINRLDGMSFSQCRPLTSDPAWPRLVRRSRRASSVALDSHCCYLQRRAARSLVRASLEARTILWRRRRRRNGDWRPVAPEIVDPRVGYEPRWCGDAGGFGGSFSSGNTPPAVAPRYQTWRSCSRLSVCLQGYSWQLTRWIFWFVDSAPERLVLKALGMILRRRYQSCSVKIWGHGMRFRRLCVWCWSLINLISAFWIGLCGIGT